MTMPERKDALTKRPDPAWCTCGDCCGEHGPDVRCLNCPAVECEGRDHDAP